MLKILNDELTKVLLVAREVWSKPWVVLSGLCMTHVVSRHHMITSIETNSGAEHPPGMLVTLVTILSIRRLANTPWLWCHGFICYSTYACTATDLLITCTVTPIPSSFNTFHEKNLLFTLKSLAYTNTQLSCGIPCRCDIF